MGRGITALPSQCTLDVFGQKNDRGVNEFVILRGKHHTLDDCAPQIVQGVSECRAIFHSNRNDSAAARDTLF